MEFLSPAERFSFKIFIPLYGAPQAQKNLVFLSLKALCMKKGLTFLGTRGAVGLPPAPAPPPAPHHPHPHRTTRTAGYVPDIVNLMKACRIIRGNVLKSLGS